MASPEPNSSQEQQDSLPEVPPASPAYSTPPSEGLPDAETSSLEG